MGNIRLGARHAFAEVCELQLHCAMLAAAIFALVLLIALPVCVEIGRRFGLRAKTPKINPVIESVIYGLFGLLVAFTFSGAATRFDGRRKLMGEEANAIGTAYLRLDALPEPARQPLREKFKRYLDSRIAMFDKTDLAEANVELAHAEALQDEIWKNAIDAIGGQKELAIVVLPPINAMIDVTTTQTVAMETHPPKIVFVMLGGLALLCGLLAGYKHGGGGRSFYAWFFAVALAGTTYVIVDIEYPRLGLIRVDDHHVLGDLRKRMN